MPFFQNPFNQEFRGSLPFGDRQYSLTFVVPPNKNQCQNMIAWNPEPYDFSVVSDFTINFAIDNKEFKNYAALTINVAGADPSVTTANEVVTLLNEDEGFSGWFNASLVEFQPGIFRVGIKTNSGKQQIRVYINNAGAEQSLGFNKYAGVAELPTYYARHTVANRFDYPDSLAALIQLDESDATVDQPIITNSGLDFSAMQADWQLLRGRVGIFAFKKQTVDGSNRVTEVVEYSAGSQVGDIAKKINYTYSGANTTPSNITEIPHTLTDGDLISP